MHDLEYLECTLMDTLGYIYIIILSYLSKMTGIDYCTLKSGNIYIYIHI